MQMSSCSYSWKSVKNSTHRKPTRRNSTEAIIWNLGLLIPKVDELWLLLVLFALCQTKPSPCLTQVSKLIEVSVSAPGVNSRALCLLEILKWKCGFGLHYSFQWPFPDRFQNSSFGNQCRDCQSSLSTQFLSPLPLRQCFIFFESSFRTHVQWHYDDTCLR